MLATSFPFRAVNLGSVRASLSVTCGTAVRSVLLSQPRSKVSELYKVFSDVLPTQSLPYHCCTLPQFFSIMSFATELHPATFIPHSYHLTVKWLWIVENIVAAYNSVANDPVNNVAGYSSLPTPTPGPSQQSPKDHHLPSKDPSSEGCCLCYRAKKLPMPSKVRHPAAKVPDQELSVISIHQPLHLPASHHLPSYHLTSQNQI